MANDLRNGDYASFYLNAVGLMIPGVTGLGMLSHADEAYDALRLSDDIFTPSMGHSDYYADAINIKIPGLPDGNWTFVGYHGTTSIHIDSILAGINPPKPGMNFGGSQLGDGFYATKTFNTSRIFANEAIKVELEKLIKKYGVTEAMNMAPSPIIFEIYAKDFNKMSGSTVFEEFGWWEDFQPELWKEYDYLQAPITGYPSRTQIKFNSSAYNNLIAILNR
ncbi:MAG: hypothetical protein KF758_05480 [Anaerolineales bacterium]|nr:hypothetical protein [Anaerolineales bacterium]MBX3036347.1 hypothetical protein [Anaerolineales bacterium]